MATTKIWPIKDSLSRVVKYANNPEKTEYSDVARVLHYASNPEKSVLNGEKFYLSTAINCRGDPLESMLKVQKHFNAKGENLAYHAYQSFLPGEVTPELCHKIGVEMAKRIWGSHYQVLVATHLNREHLHNHFVISAVSFRNGKKLDTGRNYWKRVLAPTSDSICNSYGLSVVKEQGASTPRKIYEAEKRGEPTRYNLMRQALRDSLNLATSKWDLMHYLRDVGYELVFRQDNEPKIRSIFSNKWVNLPTLGPEFNNSSISSAIEINKSCRTLPYSERLLAIKKRNGYYSPIPYHLPKSLEPYPHKLTLLGTILRIFLEILGLLPEQQGQKYVPLSPEMKERQREDDRLSTLYVEGYNILTRKNMTTASEVLDYMQQISEKANDLRQKRQPLYRKAEKAESLSERADILAEIREINRQLKTYRLEKSALTLVLNNSGVMAETIRNEMQMRKEARERDYLPRPEIKKEEPKKEPEEVPEEDPEDRNIPPEWRAAIAKTMSNYSRSHRSRNGGEAR